MNPVGIVNSSGNKLRCILVLVLMLLNCVNAIDEKNVTSFLNCLSDCGISGSTQLVSDGTGVVELVFTQSQAFNRSITLMAMTCYEYYIPNASILFSSSLDDEIPEAVVVTLDEAIDSPAAVLSMGEHTRMTSTLSTGPSATPSSTHQYADHTINSNTGNNYVGHHGKSPLYILPDGLYGWGRTNVSGLGVVAQEPDTLGVCATFHLNKFVG